MVVIQDDGRVTSSATREVRRGRWVWVSFGSGTLPLGQDGRWEWVEAQER